MNEIRDNVVELAGGDNELLFFDAPPEKFDDCIVGVARRFHDTVVAYDQEKVLAYLAREFAEDCEPDQDPMTEAMDWFEYNTIGGWIGEKTPVFVTFLDRTEETKMADEKQRTLMDAFLDHRRRVMESFEDYLEDIMEIQQRVAEDMLTVEQQGDPECPTT